MPTKKGVGFQPSKNEHQYFPLHNKFSGFWSLISATLIFYSSLYFCSKFDNPDWTDPQNKILVCAGKKKQFFVGLWLEKLFSRDFFRVYGHWTITVQYHSKEVLRGWLSKWQSLYIINSYMRSQGEFPLAPPSRTTVVLGAVKLNCHRAIAEVYRVHLKMNELCSIYRDKRTIKVFFTIGWKKT